MAIHHCSLPTCSATTIAVITEEHRTVDGKNLIDTKPHDHNVIMTFKLPFNFFVLFVCLLLFATSEVDKFISRSPFDILESHFVRERPTEVRLKAEASSPTR